MPESMSIPPPTFTTPPAPPKEKYVGDVPDCEQLRRQIPGLPPLRSGNNKPDRSTDLSLYCDFRELGVRPYVSLEMTAWRNDLAKSQYDSGGSRIPPEVGRGRGLARDRFANFSNLADDGPVDDLGVGEKAKWQRPSNDESCYLIILDENAVFLLRYEGVGKPSSRSDECRGPLRALAKPFYEALQPK